MAKRETGSLEEIGRRVCDRYDAGVSYAANFRQRIDLLAPYIEPTRSGIMATHEPGAALMSRMYDSEGISSADLAVRHIGSILHSPGTKWFGLEDENEAVNAEDEGREWYEDCRDRMLKQCSHGAFYPESYESDMDWVGFGTGLLRVEQNPMLIGREQFGFRGVRFAHHKIGRVVAYENGIGQVDEDYIELKKSAKAAADLWGLENLPENIRQAHENGKADQFRFIHGVYPRKQGEKLYGNKAMPWASCYVHYDTKRVVYESGYDEFPDCVPRWSRCHGEPYGRGLGEIALNSLITLNAATKHDLEAMALRIKPPLAQRNDSVIGTRRFSPWGVTVVRTAPGESVQNALAPIVTNAGGYSFSQVDAKVLKQEIRRIFYADVLEQLMALEGQQEMRVYVFQQKQSIIQKMLGPTYGRWESEFGLPFVSRLFNMMYREGSFAPVPDVILELGGQPKVKFESQLARAQRMEETEAMTQARESLQPIVEMQLQEWKMTGKQPADWVLDNYDFDKYTEKVNRNHGVPASVTRSRREVMALRQSRAQAEQQAQVGAEASQLAQGIGQVAPAIKALGDMETQGEA